METIPTPRCDKEDSAHKRAGSHDDLVPLIFAQQLERELYIAKQALETIANNNHSTWAEAVSTAEDALVDINALSA